MYCTAHRQNKLGEIKQIGRIRDIGYKSAGANTQLMNLKLRHF